MSPTHRAGAKGLLLASVVLLILSGFASMGPGPPSVDVWTAAPPSTLRIGETQEPDSLNPFVGTSGASYDVLAHVYDLLVGIGEDLTPVPQLARNWTVSADELVWTFNLYPGIVWHDDTPTTPRPFTSADVKFTYEYTQNCRLSLLLGYVGDPTNPNGVFINRIDTPSPTQVVIHTNRPKANMLSLYVPILPQHIWNAVGCAQAKQGFKNLPPIGTGMYRFIEWRQGQFLRLVLNDRYHFLAPPKDYVDEIVYVYYNTPAAVLNDFLLGNLDATDALTAQQFLSLRSDIDGGTANPDADPDPDISKFVKDAIELAMLGFCSASDVLISQYGVSGDRHWLALNLTIRQAVANAINKTGLVDSLWSGTDAATGLPRSLARPGGSLIPPATPFWHYNVTAQEDLVFSLAQAAARLSDPAGDGYTTTDGNPPNLLGSNLNPASTNNRDAFGDLDGDGVRDVIDMAYVAARNPDAAPQGNRGVRGSAADRLSFGLWIINNDQSGMNAAGLFIPTLNSIGIGVDTKLVSDAQQLAASYACDYDWYVWSWGFDVDPDSGLSVMTKDQILGWSDSWYYNVTYDSWYVQQQQETDPYPRQTIVHAMQRLLYRDQPYNVLWYPQTFTVVRSDRFTDWGDWTLHPGLGLAGFGNVFTMLRVTPVFGVANLCPSLVTIDAPIQPRVVFAGAVASFNGSATEPDADALNWTWDWNDGSLTNASTPAGNTSVGIMATHTWTLSGDYNITLTAADGLCGTSVTSSPVWVRVIPMPPPVGWIAGTVTDSLTGLPIAGATVGAMPGAYSTSTAADGTYNLTVSPGTYDVTASSPLYTSANVSVAVAQNATTPVDFQLVPLPGWIAGIVTDLSTGLPVPGATITAVPGVLTTTTAIDGTYNLSAAPGAYAVRASHVLYASVSQGAAVASAATTTVDFQLPPGPGWIAGIVTDAVTGLPISGAMITVVPGGLTTTTASNGTYNVSVTPGTYTVTASMALYVSQNQSVNVAASATTPLGFALQLEPGWIAGTVTDAITGLPISGAVIGAMPGGFTTSTAPDGSYNLTVNPGSYTVTGSRTSYTSQSQAASIAPAETTTVDFQLQPVPGWIAGTVTDASTGLPISGALISVAPGGLTTTTAVDGTYNLTAGPGAYTVTASKSAYIIQSAGATVGSGGTTVVSFALGPQPGWIAGTVTDARTGAPVPGATISTVPGGLTTTTAADGTYNLSLGQGTYTITSSKSLFVSQSRGVTVGPAATTTSNFQLQPEPGWIAGRVTDATTGLPLSGVTLKAVDASGSEIPAATAADGTYNLTLPVGSYTLAVILAPGYTNQSRSGVPVVSGQTNQVNFQLAISRGSISGRVTGAGTGQPLSGVTVRVMASSGQEYVTVTASDGTFSVSVPPGIYSITAVGVPGYMDQARTGVSVTDGQALQIDFQLETVPAAGVSTEIVMAGGLTVAALVGAIAILLLRRRKRGIEPKHAEAVSSSRAEPATLPPPPEPSAPAEAPPQVEVPPPPVEVAPPPPPPPA